MNQLHRSLQVGHHNPHYLFKDGKTQHILKKAENQTNGCSYVGCETRQKKIIIRQNIRDIYRNKKQEEDRKTSWTQYTVFMRFFSFHSWFLQVYNLVYFCLFCTSNLFDASSHLLSSRLGWALTSQTSPISPPWKWRLSPLWKWSPPWILPHSAAKRLCWRRWEVKASASWPAPDIWTPVTPTSLLLHLSPCPRRRTGSPLPVMHLMALVTVWVTEKMRNRIERKKEGKNWRCYSCFPKATTTVSKW